MMKKLSIAAAVMSALLAAGCSNGDNEQKVTSESEKAQAVATTDEAQSSTENSDVTASNPFFEDWDTPYGIPPFDQIKDEHFKPAFEKAIAEVRAEVEAIANNPEEPTFANTIEAMEYT